MHRQLTWILILLAMACQGQSMLPDTALRLPGIEISASRTAAFLPGNKTEPVDTLLLRMRPSASVSAILAEHSKALVRSYGTGGLATLSLRGTLSTQSGVLWNGFNLNQPNMGMADLSLIPANFFDRIEIQSGGSGSLAGNGMIGGHLNLSTITAFESGPEISCSAGLGSFGESHASMRLKFGSKRFTSSTSLGRFVDKNKFPYRDLSGNRKILDHAIGRGLGLLNQSELKLGRYCSLSSGAWFQNSDREIPPTIVMQTNDQQQLDQSLRFTVQYSFLTGNQRLQLRSAWFKESIHFTSPRALIDALYKLRTSAMEAEYRRILGRFTVNGGGTFSLIRADVPYYASGDQRQRGGAVFLSALYAHKSQPFRAALNLRKEWAESYRIPVCPSLSMEADLNKRWNAKLTLSRNFRIPTMNDRFWVPGGNPGLVPENSWNQEFNVSYSARDGQYPVRVLFEAGAYNMVVTNLIQWVNVNSTLWSPQNVSKVWSRGVETGTKLTMEGKRIRSRLHVNYYYAPATLSGSSLYNDKQLIYIPLHRFSVLADCSYHTYTVLMSCSSNGKRYVNQDNSDDLPWYTLFNLSLQKASRFKKTMLLVQLELNNLFNAEYQVVKYYPEPGRSIKVNVQITI